MTSVELRPTPAIQPKTWESLVPPLAKHVQLQLFTQWLGPQVAVVSASGDIDASNADTLLQYVLRKAVLCRALVLDLTGVTFFSSAGYECLTTVHARCARADVAWVIVPSSWVARVVDICDPEHRIAQAATIADALSTICEDAPE